MRCTRAEINLKALKHNFDGIRKRVGTGVRVMGIVKANAYGHGMTEVADALAGFGCDYLGVGFLEEGIALREHGTTLPVLVLGGVLGSQVSEFLRYELDITVSSIFIAEQVQAEAAKRNMKARVHLKIDTGMERIGIRAENAGPFIRRVSEMKNLEIAGIYSHFATSDERDKTFAREQLNRFNKVLEGMNSPPALVHIAASGAIIDLPASYYSMVRPGIMLYGCYPSHETSESVRLEPVLSLKSQVVYLKEVPANTSVSYGRKYYTKSDTRIATVPIGYGDGYSRRLTNNTAVLIGGRRFPVVGTICMDQIMVDVGMNPAVSVGDEVVLVGRQGQEEITMWELADTLGTIPYELLTGILPRVPRIYSN
ncbi:MAG TPA: alanine racemase [Bacteroidota bacterium]|nr:alanine racemase [Bacteroidota bacterium]